MIEYRHMTCELEGLVFQAFLKMSTRRRFHRPTIAYNAPMLTFRLKYLFCLILVVGVALMWWSWCSSGDVPASAILAARQKSFSMSGRLAREETVETLGFSQWIKIDNQPMGSPLSPHRGGASFCQ
jgi:hypothetical protein